MFDYEYFDWNNLIDEGARDRMCADVKNLIDSGKYWTNSPKFQTNINVFGIDKEDWINLKMSFIWSCFAYMKQEVQIKQIQSWSFMTSLKSAEDRDILWHHHNHNDATKTVSGVYYMHLPEDVADKESAGTELAPNGVDADGKFFCEWRTGHWMIYPGKIWHRPGILQSHKDRYIVAADMEF